MRVLPALRAIVYVVGIYLWAAPTSAITAQTPDRRTVIADTVSVVDLRVSRKARQHLEKAKEAARAEREDVYQREIMKALAIAPEFPEAYLLMADRENHAGRYDAAIAYAVKAQTIDPGTPWAPVVIASAYNGQQRYDDAFVVLNNLHGVDTGSWQSKYEMARAEIGRHNVEGALSWSKRALEAAPRTVVDARLLMANALQLAHRWRDATVQMQLYLASQSPLVHRASVEAAMEHTTLLAEAQERGTAAATE